MRIDKLREFIAEELGHPDSVMFDSPDFDNSVVGIDEATGAVVYNYSDMVDELATEFMEDNEEVQQLREEAGLSEEEIGSNMAMEAVDFIDYNTLRAIPYMPEPKPIIMIPISKEDYE